MNSAAASGSDRSVGQIFGELGCSPEYPLMGVYGALETGSPAMFRDYPPVTS